MPIHEEYLDLLQNLELAVVDVWRQHHEMSDYVAARAYEAAFQLYRAELRGHEPKPVTLTGLDAEAFEAVKAMCESPLGRRAKLGAGRETIPPVPLDKLCECLRELKRSVERHTRVDGRQGYLGFIDRYL